MADTFRAVGPERLTFVCVHGAFHGGWSFARVARLLRASGHDVFTPTLTGLGERQHLLHPSVGLETFGTDIANMIEFEELEDVILVGHSFAGAVVPLVADVLHDRLSRLVYLDAVVTESGESVFDCLPTSYAASRRSAAEDAGRGLVLPVPEPETIGVETLADIDWVGRRLTPHPLKSYEDRFGWTGSWERRLPKTYIACTASAYANLAATRDRVRRQNEWDWRELPTGHCPIYTAPVALSDMLLAVSSS